MFFKICSIIKRNKYKSQKIKVVKNWLKLKSVHNISVFWDFANFYQQFIQSFSRIIASLTSILKIIRSSDKLVFSKNNNSRSAFSRNNNNRPIIGRNNGNDEVKFDDDNMKYARKLGQLKDQKLAKF